MTQYATPQFIEEEGKIISFLTYRQFFILVGGGAICVLWNLILPTFLFIFFAIATMLLAAGIAFLKINNTSIVTLLLNFLGFTIRKKTYTWQKKEGAYGPSLKESPEIKIVPETPLSSALTMQPSKLRNLQKNIETKK